MQIVIDIPKGHKFIGYYTYFDGLNLYHSGSDLMGLIVLPEKHGRLIDGDLVEVDYTDYCNVNDLPTIIPATEDDNVSSNNH